ncbi:MAG: hypothetical protein H0V27_15480 [Pyrinomonadaceae bacterium]|nr:hypothetical protein [Pyrinomonadaceae bacterium]
MNKNAGEMALKLFRRRCGWRDEGAWHERLRKFKIVGSRINPFSVS